MGSSPSSRSCTRIRIEDRRLISTVGGTTSRRQALPPVPILVHMTVMDRIIMQHPSLGMPEGMAEVLREEQPMAREVNTRTYGQQAVTRTPRPLRLPRVAATAAPSSIPFSKHHMYPRLPCCMQTRERRSRTASPRDTRRPSPSTTTTTTTASTRTPPSDLHIPPRRRLDRLSISHPTVVPLPLAIAPARCRMETTRRHESRRRVAPRRRHVASALHL